MATFTMAELKKELELATSTGTLRDERGRNRNFQVNDDLGLKAIEREVRLAGTGRRGDVLKCDVNATSEAELLASALHVAPVAIKVETTKDTLSANDKIPTIKVVSRLAKEAGLESQLTEAYGAILNKAAAVASNPEKAGKKKAANVDDSLVKS